MGTSAHGWKIKQLSKDPNDIATDEAKIRWIFAAKEASVVHCTLPPKATSVATRLVGIHEIWYFFGGQGKIWLREKGGPSGLRRRSGQALASSYPQVSISSTAASERIL